MYSHYYFPTTKYQIIGYLDPLGLLSQGGWWFKPRTLESASGLGLYCGTLGSLLGLGTYSRLLQNITMCNYLGTPRVQGIGLGGSSRALNNLLETENVKGIAVVGRGSEDIDSPEVTVTTSWTLGLLRAREPTDAGLQ